MSDTYYVAVSVCHRQMRFFVEIKQGYRKGKKETEKRKRVKQQLIVTEIPFFSFLSPPEKHFEVSICQLPENWEQPCDHHFESRHITQFLAHETELLSNHLPRPGMNMQEPLRCREDEVSLPQLVKKLTVAYDLG
jgi:hypothetical protein